MERMSLAVNRLAATAAVVSYRIILAVSHLAPCPLPCQPHVFISVSPATSLPWAPEGQCPAKLFRGLQGVSHETRNRGSEATGKMSVRVNTAPRTKAQQPGRLGLGEPCFVSPSVLHPWVRGAPRPKARHMQGPAGTGHLASSMATSSEEEQPFTLHSTSCLTHSSLKYRREPCEAGPQPHTAQ